MTRVMCSAANTSRGFTVYSEHPSWNHRGCLVCTLKTCLAAWTRMIGSMIIVCFQGSSHSYSGFGWMGCAVVRGKGSESHGQLCGNGSGQSQGSRSTIWASSVVRITGSSKCTLHYYTSRVLCNGLVDMLRRFKITNGRGYWMIDERICQFLRGYMYTIFNMCFVTLDESAWCGCVDFSRLHALRIAGNWFGGMPPQPRMLPLHVSWRGLFSRYSRRVESGWTVVWPDLSYARWGGNVSRRALIFFSFGFVVLNFQAALLW